MFIAQATASLSPKIFNKPDLSPSALQSIHTKSKAVDNVISQYTTFRTRSHLIFQTMSQHWLSVAPPVSRLARYRTLSPLAGVRVSPIQLGGGNIGDKWHEFGAGSMDKESSFKLLDAYFDLGVR